MNFNTNEFGNRLAEARKKIGMNQQDFADDMSVSKATISLYERGERYPDAKFLNRMLTVYNVSADWLITGKEEGKQLTISNDKYMTLPHFDIEASAGGGSLVEIETANGVLAFDRKEMERLGVTEKNSGVIDVRGNSMEPTIMDYSRIVIKYDEKEILDGYIYVFNRNGHLFIKRLKLDMKGLHIISDNPQYPDEFLTYDEIETMPIHIIGRVIINQNYYF